MENKEDDDEFKNEGYYNEEEGENKSSDTLIMI